MFNKLLAHISILILLIAVGCTGSSNPSDSAPVGLGPGNMPPEDATWISPAKVMVANFHPGGRAEYNLTIHNGKKTTTEFTVLYRYPDHVGTGYNMPPAIVQEWVIITDSSIVLQGRETRDVLIILAMPSDATIEFKTWEFWVAVMEKGQTGLVRTEMATRWLVSMR